MVLHKGGVTKPREWISLGFRVDGSLGVTNNDISTAHCALMRRLFYFCKFGKVEERLLTDRSEIDDLMKPFNTAYNKIAFKSVRLTSEQFVAMYHGPKRRLYEQAAEELGRCGLKRRHAVAQTFVKFEKVKVDGDPRVIQPRDPVYNVALGKYLKHNEHRLYRKIKKIFGTSPVVLKGYNVNQVGEILHDKWNQFTNPVAVAMDASRFDMHVTAEMLEWEHDIYKSMFPGDKRLAKLLEMQVHNDGVVRCADGTIRYKIKGARFSGDMNTGLGNCLITCAAIYSYTRSCGLRCEVYNNGDDFGVICEKKDLHMLDGVPSFFRKLGFRMEVETPVETLEEIEFCQMHPIFNGNSWVMVRNWKTVMNKDSMCIKPFQNVKGLKKWMYSVGECGIKTYGNVPILGELYRKYLEHGVYSAKIDNDNVFRTGMRMYWSKNVDWSNEPISSDHRFSFYKAFGVTPDEQIAIETEIRSVEMNFSEQFTEEFNFNEF
jgi:hypothetical protein